jgi:uncharacterized RDD family membrane protein YckC
MEVWIVEDGEKRGPFQTYEVRDRIEREELTGEELAWHKDQDQWVALKEMDVFQGEFSDRDSASATPPPLPDRPYPCVRFFARWFDLTLYTLFLFALLKFTGQDILAAWFSSFRYFCFLPYVILEALFLHLYKTTPGKFLLGIRVVTPEEEPLPLGVSLTRSLRVYIVGMGLLIGILPVICHALCLWYSLKNNEAPWDTISGMKVRVVGLLFLPVMLFMMLFMIILVLLFLVLMPTIFQFLELLKEQGLGT